jgi:hypothetical protein
MIVAMMSVVWFSSSLLGYALGFETEFFDHDVYQPSTFLPDAAVCKTGTFPDPACTTGDVLPIGVDVVCKQSTRYRRNVNETTKRAVFEEYGISWPQPEGAYEVDHFVPLALAGSDSTINLWPEAAEPRPGYHEKDAVELFLYHQVCSGRMTLLDAQTQIKTNWLTIYERMPK